MAGTDVHLLTQVRCVCWMFDCYVFKHLFNVIKNYCF